jgi:hypothetical protein
MMMTERKLIKKKRCRHKFEESTKDIYQKEIDEISENSKKNTK